MADHRTEYLIYHAIWACPPWCVRNDEEVSESEHFSAWETVLDLTDSGLDVQILARMRREHWLHDHEADCQGRIEVAIAGGDAGPSSTDPQGTLSTLWLDPDQLTLICEAYTGRLADMAADAATSCDDAEGTTEEWVWSFDGAEAHAAAQVAAEDAEQANAS